MGSDERNKKMSLREYTQLKRHMAWDIMKYLKNAPEIVNSNHNREIYDAVRETQVKYWMSRKMNKQDAEKFVDLMSDLEIKSHHILMCFDQETLDLFHSQIEKDAEYYRKYLLAMRLYKTEHEMLFDCLLDND